MKKISYLEACEKNMFLGDKLKDWYQKNKWVKIQEKTMSAKYQPYGKIFCWHDYTVFWKLGTNVNAEFTKQCTKCGKLKLTKKPSRGIYTPNTSII